MTKFLRYTLFVALLALAFSPDVRAQISFSEDDFLAEIGNTYTYEGFQAESGQDAIIQTLVDNTGANKTWDFTALTFSTESDSSVAQQYIELPADLPGANDPRVADATFAIRVEDPNSGKGGSTAATDFVAYYSTSPTEFNGYGFFAVVDGENFDQLYNDPLLENPFPLTFGVTWEDSTTYSQVIEGFGTINITQVQAGNANGWGTLITPNGTESVLRYELDITLKSVIPGFGTQEINSKAINFITKSGLTASISIQEQPGIPGFPPTIITTASHGSRTGSGGGGNPPNAAPGGLTPIDAATDVSTSPDLSWDAVDTATSYDLQVSDTPTFSKGTGTSTLLVDETGLTATSFSVTGLAEGTMYYWRARGANENGAGPWATQSFTTAGGATAPGAVALTSPDDDASDVDASPTLMWNAADGADSYDVQVSTDAGFATTVVDETGVTATELAVSSLAANTRHYWRVRGVNAVGAGDWSSRSFTTASGVAIEQLDTGVPTTYALYPSYPNPFNPETTIRFDVPESALVSLSIYDALGREVATLVSRTLSPGSYQYSWDASGQPSGIYLYRLQAANFSKTGTMMLLK